MFVFVRDPVWGLLSLWHTAGSWACRWQDLHVSFTYFIYYWKLQTYFQRISNKFAQVLLQHVVCHYAHTSENLEMKLSGKNSDGGCAFTTKCSEGGSEVLLSEVTMWRDKHNERRTFRNPSSGERISFCVGRLELENYRLKKSISEIQQNYKTIYKSSSKEMRFPSQGPAEASLCPPVAAEHASCGGNSTICSPPSLLIVITYKRCSF